MFSIDIYDMPTLWVMFGVMQIILAALFFWNIKLQQKYPDHRCGNEGAIWAPAPLAKPDSMYVEPPLMGKIDDNVLNAGATSFLRIDKEESVIESALKNMEKYGVGSCGPRGFYGTIDVHLELEERLAKFLEVEETCVYSYGFSTIASAIPAYAKKEDIIFADENVWFAIQKGIDASRSTVRYFKHNDDVHLEKLLSSAALVMELNPRRRAFLIIEAIYLNTGEMCPLLRMVELARKYKLRIILDESLTIGVLGGEGRGLVELLGIPRHQIDLVVGSLEHSFATIGGFCAGSHYIVEHQRLSGLGYCFSASLPPMLTQAAISALDILEEKPEILCELRELCTKLDLMLPTLRYYTFRGHELSPIKHVYLKNDTSIRQQQSHLYRIAEYGLQKGVAFAVSAYIPDAERKCPDPSIRLAVNRGMTYDNIRMICSLLDEAYEKTNTSPRL